MLLEHILMMNPGGNINFEIKEVGEKINSKDTDKDTDRNRNRKVVHIILSRL